MSVCVLDERKFRVCCQLLLRRSQQLSDGWSWEGVQGSEEGFLKKTELRSVVLDSSTKWDLEEPSQDWERLSSCQQLDKEPTDPGPDFGLGAGPGPYPDSGAGDLGDEEEDSICAEPAVSSSILQYEYHILFSCSYATPVLYFRAATLEGRSLSLEEVWSSVHPNLRRHLEKNPLSTITLQEHPVLGQPFFMLHPCRTEEFMKPVLEGAGCRSVNFVLSWLSVVAPLVGLHLPLDYCTPHMLHLTDPAGPLTSDPGVSKAESRKLISDACTCNLLKPQDT